MSRTVLLVESNDSRRVAIRAALGGRGINAFEVQDAFAGLAALGRADFGAVILAEGRRTLSLKGLCQLARKRHEGIRIYVILAAAANGERIKSQLGDDVIPVPPDWSVEKLASEVQGVLEQGGGPAPNPWRGESDAGGRASSGKSTPSAVDLGPVVSTPAVLSLEGTFDDGEGPALLMGLFSQELTGRLVVERAGTTATVYVFEGEPAWADEAEGDVAVHRRVVGRGLVPPELQFEPVPDGELLASLLRQGLIDKGAVVDVARDAVRDVVLELATLTDGSYRFLEDRAMRDVPPLFRVNPFGLVFDSRRRTNPPDKLVAMAGEMAGKYLLPGPALRAAAPKLKAFVRDRDVSELINGRTTVATFTDETGLDHLMGALMVLSLTDARLARLGDEPISAEDSLVLAGTALSPVDVRSTNVTLAPNASDDEKRAHFRSLYMRVRALTQPTQVLGVPVHAGRDEMRRAFDARMRELDPTLVPEGADRDAIVAMVDELRAKVQNAYETLTIQLSMGGTDSVPGIDLDSNPF